MAPLISLLLFTARHAALADEWHLLGGSMTAGQAALVDLTLRILELAEPTPERLAARGTLRHRLTAEAATIRLPPT